MTLPSSGQISLSQVASELGRAANATTSLGESAVRSLAGVASGAISLSNLWGKSNAIQKGYTAGGVTSSTYYSEIDGMDFATETGINPAAALPSSRGQSGGVNSNTRGYSIGGYASGGTATTTIYAFTFDTESINTSGATLSLARGGMAGAGNSSTRGYGFGGFAGTYTYSEIDGIDFATETSINPSAALPAVRGNQATVCSATAAFIMGGIQGYAMVTGIVKFLFAAESAADISATLVLARGIAAGVNDSNYGYAMGGYAGSSYYSEIDGINFATETGVNPAAALTTTGSTTGVNSKTSGYSMGSNNPNSSVTISSFSFATQSTATASGTLAVARANKAGYQPYNNNP